MNKLFSFNSGNTTEKKKHEKLSTLYLRNGFNADTGPGASFSKVPKVPKGLLQETE